MIEKLVNRTLLSDQVYDLLRAGLLAQEYEPGSRLVESEIARKLDVSQAPVRDALRTLAHEGLILQFPRRGSFVAHISVERAREAYAVRVPMERVAVQGFLQRDNTHALGQLGELLAQMRSAAANDDLHGLITADISFHRTVWEYSGNETLYKVWSIVEFGMRDLTPVSNRVYFHDLQQIADTHEPLIVALTKADPNAPELFASHAEEVWNKMQTADAAKPTIK